MRGPTLEAHRRIQAEITREKAAALGRAGERLEAALEAVARAARRLDSAVDSDTRARVASEHAAALGQARQARLMLIIQREAIGFRNHRVVDQQFPEPPRGWADAVP